MRIKSLVLAGFLTLAGAAAAEAQVRFAPQVAFGTESDFGIGGRVNFPLTQLFNTAGFFGVGEFNYFFPGGNVNYWELNANLNYLIPGVRGNVHPYAGGGANLGHVSVDNCTGDCSSTDIGLNLVGGINIETRTKMMPFIEGRIQLGHGDQVVFTGGLYF